MLRRIVGVAQHYPWGDHTSIPTLLGLKNDGNSWAEMWFGTHHVAPSHIDNQDGAFLKDVSGEMEMLVKLLAAGQPLSLQTHPTKEQAEKGFALENAAGLDIGQPNRMYRDASDKPEILIALTAFEALCGFQKLEAIVDAFNQMQWTTERDFLTKHGMAKYMKWCFDQSEPADFSLAPMWLQKLADLYPSDRALRLAPTLNHVLLSPGQAICLPAGNLHAYIKGLGIEVMNSSDNVIRAGFTSKHINVEELLAIVDTSPLLKPVIEPDSTGMYTSPSEVYTVQRIISDNDVHFDAKPHHRIIFGPISLANNGFPEMYFLGSGETGDLQAGTGDTIFVCHQL